jgi:hypothetical protein
MLFFVAFPMATAICSLSRAAWYITVFTTPTYVTLTFIFNYNAIERTLYVTIYTNPTWMALAVLAAYWIHLPVYTRFTAVISKPTIVTTVQENQTIYNILNYSNSL